MAGAAAEAAPAPAPMADKYAATHIGHLGTSTAATAGNQVTRPSRPDDRARITPCGWIKLCMFTSNRESSRPLRRPGSNKHGANPTAPE
jgi:hypothetical protein